MKEVKICKICGRTLPLEEMIGGGRGNVCKKCYNEMRRQKRKEARIQDYLNDDSRRFSRSYKEVLSERTLTFEDSQIIPIKEDEVFVRLIDYRDTWISNYGRAVTKCGDVYSMKRMKRTEAGEIAYHLYRHAWNGDKWSYVKVEIEAWRLVVGAFVVNHDIVNNNQCWHSGNNLDDLYFKNLYPMNEYQHDAMLEKFSATGNDSEENIYNIINSPDYQVDGWNPVRFKRTTIGVGYLGNAEVDVSSVAYIKWMNMMHRCYYWKEHEAKPYYKDITVCEEWHNFSNFKHWFDQNYIPGRRYDLDKDILVKGNTVYSSETCALVTHYANTIFENRIDGMVKLNEESGKYNATMSFLGKVKEVGSYDTLDEAWKGVFQYKEKYIRRFARRSKNRIPDKVYFAMMSWKVEEIA